MDQDYICVDVLEEFKDLKNVNALNEILQKENWHIIKKIYEKDKPYYQLYYGKGKQVDNSYEYGFPYLLDKKETCQELERFVNFRTMLNNSSKESNELRIKMDAFYAYKMMPEWHKNNLKDYYFLDGIYTVSPNICDEDAQFIFSVCQKVENENVNPFSISHFLTEHYIHGNLTKEQLEKADSGEISPAVFYDDLDYFNSVSEEKTIDICD